MLNINELDRKQGKLDFDQRYSVMRGTSTHATADTLEEIDGYLDSCSSLAKHFCKIGDRREHKIIEGSFYLFRRHHPEILTEDHWRPW